MTCTDCKAEGADCLTKDRVRVCADCLYERVVKERDDLFMETFRLRHLLREAQKTHTDCGMTIYHRCPVCQKIDRELGEPRLLPPVEWRFTEAAPDEPFESHTALVDGWALTIIDEGRGSVVWFADLHRGGIEDSVEAAKANALVAVRGGA